MKYLSINDIIAPSLYIGLDEELELVHAKKGQVVAFAPGAYKYATGILRRKKEWPIIKNGKRLFLETYTPEVSYQHALKVGLLEPMQIKDFYANTRYASETDCIPEAYRIVYRVTQSDKLLLDKPEPTIRFTFIGGRRAA